MTCGGSSRAYVAAFTAMPQPCSEIVFFIGAPSERLYIDAIFSAMHVQGWNSQTF